MCMCIRLLTRACMRACAARRAAAQELVSELDAAAGGEGLSCLAPRRMDSPPGAWLSRSNTWGEILAAKPAP